MKNEEKAQEIIGGGCDRQNCYECGGSLSVVEGCVEFRHLKEMAKWKEQQIIEKAADYIYKVLVGGGWLTSYQYNYFIEDFKKAMEE